MTLPAVGNGAVEHAPALRLHRRLADRDRPPRRQLGGEPRLRRAAVITPPARPTASGSTRCATTWRSSWAARPPSPRSATSALRRSPATVGTDQSAWVRQQLRADRTSPQAFDVNVAGGTAAGVKADGGLLAASGPAGTVAIALNHMHRYEPQALRLLAGRPSRHRPGGRQGLARQPPGPLRHPGGDGAVAGTPARADLDRTDLGAAQPAAPRLARGAWFAASDALDEFPVGPLPAELAGYDTAVANALLADGAARSTSSASTA